MKISIDYRLALVLCLLSAAADRAVLASEPALDGQEQAREMILGRPAAKAPIGAQVPHVRAEDPLESARRMILGSTNKANSGTATAGPGCDAPKSSLIAARP
jgi:hypothetical protein